MTITQKNAGNYFLLTLKTGVPAETPITGTRGTTAVSRETGF